MEVLKNAIREVSNGEGRLKGRTLLGKKGPFSSTICQSYKFEGGVSGGRSIPGNGKSLKRGGTEDSRGGFNSASRKGGLKQLCPGSCQRKSRRSHKKRKEGEIGKSRQRRKNSSKKGIRARKASRSRKKPWKGSG